MTNASRKPLQPLLVVVAAALIDDAGRVLVQRRPAGRSMAGLWEFPGGKVEPGEAPAAALSRELAEELGIRVAPGDLSPLAFSTGVAGGRTLLLLLYSCRRWRGDPVALDAAAIAWRTIDQVDAREMPPADGPLVDALARLLAS